MMAASKYFMLIIVVEIALFYLVRSFPNVTAFVMPVTILSFLVFAWLLKLKIPAFIVVSVLTVSYGVLSFYSDFPIYHVGYPVTFEEFLPTIGIKTGFYVFPLIAYISINFGKK